MTAVPRKPESMIAFQVVMALVLFSRSTHGYIAMSSCLRRRGSAILGRALSMESGADRQTYYITTPIYYVNDKPHIGHAYTTLACDIIARYKRLQGYEVEFLTGTDEHGQKVEQSAAKMNVPPKEYADRVSDQFRDLVTRMNFSVDQFIRTTEDRHYRAAQSIWRYIQDKGYIYKGEYSGWYSVRDEAFYTESELIDGKAPTGADVAWVTEPTYFFKLSAFQDALLELYEKEPDFVQPRSRFNEVIRFVQGGLRDLSISRTSFKWGIPVPDDPDHIMYVWFDALTNYITAIGYPDQQSERFTTFWPADLHIVGKDILRFHAVYWPAFLLAADLSLPKRIFAHGWWTKDGQKISKSIGNVIDPFELIDQYGLDFSRYFLVSEVPFGNDGDFSHEAMVNRVNNNLANELGNLAQRTLSLVFKNCDKKIPACGPLTDRDEALLSCADRLYSETSAAIDSQSLHKYCEHITSVVRLANKYIDEEAPWVLRKTDPSRMCTVLWVILEVVRIVSILYQPVIPDSSTKLLDQLQIPSCSRSFAALTDRLGSSERIAKPQAVFPRLEAVSGA